MYVDKCNHFPHPPFPLSRAAQITLAVLLTYDLCQFSAPTCAKAAHTKEDGVAQPRNRFMPKCTCTCQLRSATPWGFRTASIRERFGLLVAGYDTMRGSVVMAWEPLVVMLRKLMITLAGSLPQDP